MRDRYDWDMHFMRGTFWAAERSLDHNTQHGCIIVDDRHRVVSIGYNGPPAGMADDEVPDKAPDKYDWFIHAEENAMLFARRDLRGCAAYITGFPCPSCMAKMLQCGIRKFVWGIRGSHMIGENEKRVVYDMMAHYSDANCREFQPPSLHIECM